MGSRHTHGLSRNRGCQDAPAGEQSGWKGRVRTCPTPGRLSLQPPPCSRPSLSFPIWRAQIPAALAPGGS